MNELELVTTGPTAVAIPASMIGSRLHHHVAVAAAAAHLNLKDLNSVRRRYAIEVKDPRSPYGRVLRRAFEVGEQHIDAAQSRLRADAPPTEEVFAASAALEIAASNLLAAHSLYRVGLLHQGNAVIRMLIEQAAWACEVVLTATDLDAALPTKAIRTLKAIYPTAGMLYGHLNDSVHQQFAQHRDLTRWVADGEGQERPAVTTRHGATVEPVVMLLLAADIWVAAWEATQHDHLSWLSSIRMEKSGAVLRGDRSFRRLIFEHVEAAQVAVSEADGDQPG